MKKKLLITTLAPIAAMICTFGLAACNNPDNSEGGAPVVIPTAGLEYSQYYTCTAAACKGIGTAKSTEIVIADNYKDTTVEYVSDSAFKDCTSITSISVPDSVYTIEDSAFYGCTSLTSISLPANLHKIGSSALESCTALTSINFGGTVTEWNAIRKYSTWNNNTGNYVIHCTDGDIEKS